MNASKLPRHSLISKLKAFFTAFSAPGVDNGEITEYALKFAGDFPDGFITDFLDSFQFSKSFDLPNAKSSDLPNAKSSDLPKDSLQGQDQELSLKDKEDAEAKAIRSDLPKAKPVDLSKELSLKDKEDAEAKAIRSDLPKAKPVDLSKVLSLKEKEAIRSDLPKAKPSDLPKELSLKEKEDAKGSASSCKASDFLLAKKVIYRMVNKEEYCSFLPYEGFQLQKLFKEDVTAAPAVETPRARKKREKKEYLKRVRDERRLTSSLKMAEIRMKNTGIKL